MSQSERLPDGAQQKGRKQSDRPDPEQLPGGIDLLEYKDILEIALEAFPDIDPGVIEENTVKRTKENLEKIAAGIKNEKYKKTRERFAIEQEIVSYNVDIASNELAAVLTLVRFYAKKTSSVADKADCARQVDKSLKNYKKCVDEALSQFKRVKLLKRKKQ